MNIPKIEHASKKHTCWVGLHLATPLFMRLYSLQFESQCAYCFSDTVFHAGPDESSEPREGPARIHGPLPPVNKTSICNSSLSFSGIPPISVIVRRGSPL